MIDKGMIPADPLRDVFTLEVLEKLRSQKNPSQTLLRRIEVLTAKGPEPSDPRRRENFRTLRKLKAAWEAYLTAAFAVGLFEGKDGNDLRSRLRSPDDENFHSAIAECMAIWLLAGKLRLSVYPRPIGRKGPLEFCIGHPDGDIHVEVKAPHAPILDKVNHLWGDNSDLLQKAVESANKQFGNNVRNLLVVIPEFWFRVYTNRGQITRAFLVEQKIATPIDPQTGGPSGLTIYPFKPTGHFLETRSPSGKPFKPDNSPRFTRISAVLCIEEVIGFQQVEHEVLVVHTRTPEYPSLKTYGKDFHNLLEEVNKCFGQMALLRGHRFKLLR